MSNTQLATVAAQIAMTDMEKMAGAICKSGLFGMKTPDQALALMIIAQAEGKHPGSVAAEYHIIQGRASLKSDAMLARFLNAGGKVEWHDHTDTQVSATFSHPQGGSLRIDWDMARAKSAGLGHKDNWRTYPRQMLRARVISEGVRAVFPGVLQGLYTPEEVQEFDNKPAVTVAASSFTAASVTASTAPEEKPVVIEAEVLPATTEPAEPWHKQLEAAMAEHENEVNTFLREKEKVSEGQTWRDLPSGPYRNRIIKQADKFLAAVKGEQK